MNGGLVLGLVRVEPREALLRASLPPTVEHQLDRHLLPTRRVSKIHRTKAAAAELADQIIALDHGQRDRRGAALRRSACDDGRTLGVRLQTGRRHQLRQLRRLRRRLGLGWCHDTTGKIRLHR